MALYRTTTETRYLQYARDWAGRNGYGIHNGTPTTTWPVSGVLRHTKKTRVLYDHTRELWWRDGDAQKAVSPAGRPVFWSRGNGWALAAHAKVLAPQPDLGTRWPEYRCNMQGLARATYLPELAKARSGLVATAVRADGFPGYVQGVGYALESSRPVTATAGVGVGGFLLAATEVARDAV